MDRIWCDYRIIRYKNICNCIKSTMHLLIVLVVLLKQVAAQSIESCSSMESKYILECSSGGTDSRDHQLSRLYFRCAERCNLQWGCENFAVNPESQQCEIYTTNAQSCSKVTAESNGVWRLYRKVTTLGECGDACWNLPCLNGGTCVAVSSDTYTCNCPTWTSGDHCEEELMGVELVCDWHHGQIFADGVRVSIQTTDTYPYFHRVVIPASTEVIAIFCEDTGVGNDDVAYAVVVLSTGQLSGVTSGFMSCTSSYESGWSDVSHVDSHWQIPPAKTVNSGYWTVNDLQYNTQATDPKWISLTSQQLYCRYDRRN